MKRKTGKIRYSMRAKMTLLMLFATTGTICSLLLINNLFLEDYYLISKQTTLENTYFNICELVQSDRKKEEVALKLEGLCQKFNITYIILNVNTTGKLTPAYYNVNDVKTLEDLLMPYLFGINNNAVMLKEEEDYWIFRNEDTRFSATFLELYGVEPNMKKYMLLRIPVESIKESVDISNRFVAYVGIVVSILALIVSAVLTKRFTRPLLELAELSGKMSNLDFNAKYERHDKDEIGILGQSMNKLSEKLESTISELKSANNELQRDIEKKVQIDEMRKEFLSNVSHELKTPIALIQGYAEGLAEGINDDAESREFYCEVIMDEANKMNMMVKKLLTLNQLEFGQNQITMERFDMTALICGVLQSVEILCRQNGITVEFAQKEPVFVWGDEYQLEEVVTNYISNAIHYAMNEKKIIVSLEQKEHTVRISVFNTGNLIPEEDIDKVWIKFYKVDKARTREYGGSGIGLSIVKAAMEAHHRDYGVRNLENGVEFWFEADSDSGI